MTINIVYSEKEERGVNNHFAKGGWTFLVIFYSLFARDRVISTYWRRTHYARTLHKGGLQPQKSLYGGFKHGSKVGLGSNVKSEESIFFGRWLYRRISIGCVVISDPDCLTFLAEHVLPILCPIFKALAVRNGVEREHVRAVWLYSVRECKRGGKCVVRELNQYNQYNIYHVVDTKAPVLYRENILYKPAAYC